jgi:hypothetical protein
MIQNTTDNDQFALVYDDTFLHVVIIAPSQFIDTRLDTLEIRNSEEIIRGVINALSQVKKDIALAKLEKILEDRAN